MKLRIAHISLLRKSSSVMVLVATLLLAHITPFCWIDLNEVTSAIETGKKETEQEEKEADDYLKVGWALAVDHRIVSPPYYFREQKWLDPDLTVSTPPPELA